MSRFLVVASPHQLRSHPSACPAPSKTSIVSGDALREVLGNQKPHYSDARIPELLSSLGLDDCAEYRSKREHLQKAEDAASDPKRVAAANRALELLSLPVHERDQLQELVWDDGTAPNITGRYRRELAENLNAVELCIDIAAFEQVLSELWQIDTMPAWDFTWSSSIGTHGLETLRSALQRHGLFDAEQSGSAFLGLRPCLRALFYERIESRLLELGVAPGELRDDQLARDLGL